MELFSIGPPSFAAGAQAARRAAPCAQPCGVPSDEFVYWYVGIVLGITVLTFGYAYIAMWWGKRGNKNTR